MGEVEGRILRRLGAHMTAIPRRSRSGLCSAALGKEGLRWTREFVLLSSCAGKADMIAPYLFRVHLLKSFPYA